MKILNLTPHTVNFLTDKGTVSIEPSGTIARVDTLTTEIGGYDGIPVKKISYGNLSGLPDSADDTIYLVSSLVAQATDRSDVFVPTDFVRDDKGNITGARSLGRIIH